MNKLILRQSELQIVKYYVILIIKNSPSHLTLDMTTFNFIATKI